MANKRSLKRSINLICEELFAECVSVSLYGHNRESAQSLIFTTVKMEADFTSRVSHPEPGMPAKKYYNKLREDFVAHVGEIQDQIKHF